MTLKELQDRLAKEPPAEIDVALINAAARKLLEIDWATARFGATWATIPLWPGEDPIQN